MLNMDVNWDRDIPTVTQYGNDKKLCTIKDNDGLWLTNVASTVTYSKIASITNNSASSTIDNAARAAYVAYLFESLDNEYHDPGCAVAIIKELENELSVYATQPLQKLADCKKGWTKHLSSAVATQKMLRKRKSEILDAITEKNNKEITK